MKKAGNLIQGGLFVRLRVLKSAICAGIVVVAFATSAHALSNNVKNLAYSFHQGTNYSISYDLVLKAMKDTYKDTIQFDTNPLIGIAESDFNGDKYPEIIGFPTESHEEIGMYCNAEGLCPHYILQVREKGIRTLAVIYANSVDTGDDIKNGDWTLRAYKTEHGKDAADFDHYDTYVFDKEKDAYVLISEPKSQPPKTKAEPAKDPKQTKESKKP